MELTEHQRRVLKKLPRVLASQTAGQGNIAIVDLIVEHQEQVEKAIDEVKSLYPDTMEAVQRVRKGDKGDKGEDADEERIAQSVLGRIPVPKDGKDADEEKITKKILKKLPKPEPVDYDSITEQVLAQIPTPEPAIPESAEETRDRLESLPEGKRFHVDFLDGFNDAKDAVINRALEILDKRTQYLINKVVTSTNSFITSITTTGSSGPATVVNGVLNIPQYTGGSSTFVYNEIVSGSGNTFTLAQTPIAGSQQIYGNGQMLTPGAGNNYTISGKVLTLANSFSAGQILANYQLT